MQALPVPQNERIQIDERGDAVRDPIDDAADHAATVRVAAQDDVRQLFPLNQVDDVVDVCVQRDLRGEQV